MVNHHEWGHSGRGRGAFGWMAWGGCLRRSLGVLLLTAGAAAVAQVTHVYDELGRLVQSVVGPDVGSVQYSYDPAGNITAVKRLGVNDLSLAEFTPNSGAPGSIVTLYGSGFVKPESSNTVKFNGKPAIVKTAQMNVLTVKVPVGATTGRITVSNINGSVTSATDYVVVAGSPTPAINGFSPDVGVAGDVVTIAGANFQLDPLDNKVSFAGTLATVITDAESPTATKIKAATPPGMPSGRITVSTPYGSASSGADFFAVPAAYAPSSVQFKARATVNGPAVPVRVTSSGTRAVVIFDGNQKESVTIKSANGTFPRAVPTELYGPNGIRIQTLSLVSNGIQEVLPLPVRGTYTLVISPSGADVGALDLSLTRPETGGSLQIDAASPTTATLAANQDIAYSFDGTQGQRLHLLISESTLDDGEIGNNITTFAVHRPDGTLLKTLSQSTYSRPGAVMVLGPLAAAGTYSVSVAPSGKDYGHVKLHLRTANSGSAMQVNGMKTPVSVSAQALGYFSLAGVAGSGFKIALTDLTLSPGSGDAFVDAWLYDVDGLQVTSCQFSASTPRCDIPPSAVVKTGRYGLVFSPGYANSASFKASVTRDAELIVDAPLPTTVTVDIGQETRLGFKASVNQNLFLLGSGYSIDDGNQNTVTSSNVIVQDESGARVTSKTIWTNNKSAFLLPLAFPSSGNYSIRIVPTGQDQGQATLHLRTPGSGTPWPTNGTSSPVNLPALGLGYYSIDVTAGDYFGIVASGMNISPGTQNAVVDLTLYRPDGSIADKKCELKVGSTYCDLLAQDVPTTGRYGLLFVPRDPNSATFDLAINVQATGRLEINGPATVVNLAPAQFGKYTFTGSVGQRLGFGFTGMNTNPPGAALYFAVMSPSGSQLVSVGWSRDNGFTLPELVESGEYTVLVDPNYAASASVNLYLSSEVEGSLVVNGPAVPFNVSRAGQNGHFVFAANAGQMVSAVGTDGTFLLERVAVRAPDGSWIYGSVPKEAPQGVNFAIELGALPLTGTYELFVDPHEAETGTMNLKVVSDISGTIAIDGTPLNVNLGPGQNGRFSFEGAIGQNLGLGISNVVITPSGYWPTYSLLDPSGAQIYSNLTNRNHSTDFPTLTIPGTYTFVADPIAESGLGFTLTLSNDLTGTLVTNAPAVTYSTTRPGQNARYTFQATAHQNLALVTSNSTFGGVGGTVRVFGPDGVEVGNNSFNATVTLNDLAAGTYTALLGANGINVGSIKVQLVTQ